MFMDPMGDKSCLVTDCSRFVPFRTFLSQGPDLQRNTRWNPRKRSTPGHWRGAFSLQAPKSALLRKTFSNFFKFGIDCHCWIPPKLSLDHQLRPGKSSQFSKAVSPLCVTGCGMVTETSLGKHMRKLFSNREGSSSERALCVCTSASVAASTSFLLQMTVGIASASNNPVLPSFWASYSVIHLHDLKSLDEAAQLRGFCAQWDLWFCSQGASASTAQRVMTSPCKPVFNASLRDMAEHNFHPKNLENMNLLERGKVDVLFWSRESWYEVSLWRTWQLKLSYFSWCKWYRSMAIWSLHKLWARRWVRMSMGDQSICKTKWPDQDNR